MDKSTQQRLDAILEEEIARGFRIMELPESLQVTLQANKLPVVTHVRFSRLNPGRKRRISSEVQRQYHKDLQDESLLSNEQLMKIAERRGEWTTAHAERLGELVAETKRLQDDLYLDGISENMWTDELLANAEQFRTYITEAYAGDEKEKGEKVLTLFDRWAEYTPDRRALFTVRYAGEQGLTEYSPDRDMSAILDQVPHNAAAEMLNAIEDLKDKLIRYSDLIRQRQELAELQLRYARVFSESVESRRDNTEQMARLYYCAERCDAEGKTSGPLTKSFEELWELPEDVIEWFLTENYFFLNGLPNEVREYLSTFGFLKADRDRAEETTSSGDSEPSVESPAPPSSKDVTPLPAEMASTSSG